MNFCILITNRMLNSFNISFRYRYIGGYRFKSWPCRISNCGNLPPEVSSEGSCADTNEEEEATVEMKEAADRGVS